MFIVIALLFALYGHAAMAIVFAWIAFAFYLVGFIAKLILAIAENVMNKIEEDQQSSFFVIQT